VWTSCFMLLFGIGSVSLLWMHLAIQRQERRLEDTRQLLFLPELDWGAEDRDRSAAGEPPLRAI